MAFRINYNINKNILYIIKWRIESGGEKIGTKLRPRSFETFVES